MGMYTSLKFKGIVKPEYRETIAVFMQSLSLDANPWYATGVDFMQEFGHDYRSIFIPFGSDPDAREFDILTGAWEFDTELKNYDNTIEKFFEIVPKMMETVSECVTHYEGDDYIRSHELKEDRIVESSITSW